MKLYSSTMLKNQYKPLSSNSIFFYPGFFSQTRTIHKTTWARRGPSLFLSIISFRSQTFSHLFVTLYVRWLPRTFNRIACNYQTATIWNLPPLGIRIWLIWMWFSVLLGDLMLTLAAVICRRQAVNLNSHQLPPEYHRWAE